MKYKTIILSDLHLGSRASRTKDISDFLEKNSAETIILNGDIIDMWSLKRGSEWKSSHTKVIRRLIKLSEHESNIIYIKGNHDDSIFTKIFEYMIPFEIGHIKMIKDYTFIDIKGNKNYVFHGDVLDFFITKMKWVGVIGSIGYDFVLWLNRWYNRYREFRKLPYYSLSKDIKNGVKNAVDFINDFEKNAIKLANIKGCDVAICGHIHNAEIKENYMNSGDWCENCTALVETFDGEWKIIEHHKEII
ncbi:UDP-2,3-diacylglucosamine diphosphatase [bacterium]|jgi:UDP-2,3-diacylglucosamine pyrophosphatase LpxH|nr:UDP-2,3-diacylglucosamine diphosphatase [bacterium]